MRTPFYASKLAIIVIAGDPQKPVVFPERRARYDDGVQPITEAAALGPFAAISMGNFAGFLGLQADSAHGFSTFVEDQAVEVIG